MSRKSTIGTNPLDAVIPATKKKPATQAAPVKKQRITVQLSPDAIERIRNAVFWTPGLTMTDLVEEAVEKHLAKLERQRGDAFPLRTGKLKAGRPAR